MTQHTKGWSITTRESLKSQTTTPSRYNQPNLEYACMHIADSKLYASIPDTAAIDVWSFLLYSHSGHDTWEAVWRGVGVGAVAETGRGPRSSSCRRSIRQAMAVRRLHYAEHRGLRTISSLVRLWATAGLAARYEVQHNHFHCTNARFQPLPIHWKINYGHCTQHLSSIAIDCKNDWIFGCTGQTLLACGSGQRKLKFASDQDLVYKRPRIRLLSNYAHL